MWRHVREFAVPRSMIDAATACRESGDWAGACAAARVDIEFDLRAVARVHGAGLASEVRADLRHLAPDLLRWHLPRIAPDGLLRPGLTVPLARYGVPGAGGLQLVARTAPAWADSGQRIGLALWTGRPHGLEPHPHPSPDHRFRLDLHRHLWDARHAAGLRERAGVGVGGWDGVSQEAVHRWDAEAEILRAADGRPGVTVLVRAGPRRLSLPGPRTGKPLVLPHAATWVPPDLLLLGDGLIDADGLHPLVAAALCERPSTDASARPVDPWRTVECGGARHRIGLRDGVLAALDHDPDEVRREELLAALSGTPVPCLEVIDAAHRRPESLNEIRCRLDHGDTEGALAVAEDLLGPAAVLRDGALRDEFEAALARQETYRRYRAGLEGRGPFKPSQR